MSGRIVLYGATGYMGALTARQLLQNGARPILAGRDPSRLAALADKLSQASGGTALDTAVASAAGPGPLADLLGPGDVLVSTAGPFVKIGRSAVEAAIDAGANYLDSTGEPPFIRQVFEEFGPRAERTGATLLTAFGYDYVPGNLAGALALEAAGPEATRVEVGYYVHGDVRRATSAGTRASAAGVLLEGGYAFRDGRIVSERNAAHVRSFVIDGKSKQAFSIGSSEHFALPQLRPRTTTTGQILTQAPLTEVAVYLGWFGGATRLVQLGSAFAAGLGRLQRVRTVLDKQAQRIQNSRSAPSNDAGFDSDVVAVAADENGRSLATVQLTGKAPYAFTAAMLSWAAIKIAAEGGLPAGALGPVDAFGSDALESACASAGFRPAVGVSGPPES